MTERCASKTSPMDNRFARNRRVRATRERRCAPGAGRWTALTGEIAYVGAHGGAAKPGTTRPSMPSRDHFEPPWAASAASSLALRLLLEERLALQGRCGEARQHWTHRHTSVREALNKTRNDQTSTLSGCSCIYRPTRRLAARARTPQSRSHPNGRTTSPTLDHP